MELRILPREIHTSLNEKCMSQFFSNFSKWLLRNRTLPFPQKESLKHSYDAPKKAVSLGQAPNGIAVWTWSSS